MAVTLFVGLLAGGLLGMSVRDQRTPLCCFMMKKHPTFTKFLGLILLAGLIIVPSLALTGVLIINATPFFWGGILACSFVFGFFAASCTCTPEPQGT